MIPSAVRGILDTLARSNSTLADGAAELESPAIVTAVDQIIAFLNLQNISVTDCLAFECGNDVPSAVVLLALLASGRTFILLPCAERSIERSVSADVPMMFCRYRLEVGRSNGTGGAIVPALAGASIAIAENPHWRSNAAAGAGCFFIPTSGSTARAKLVRHRRDRLLLAAGHCAERLGLTSADRVALPVPIAHMFGLGAAFLPAVLAGASVDLQSNANVLRYFARERLFGPTVAFLTPGFADAIVRLRKTPRQYRLSVTAGDRLTADLFDRYERLHGCLVNLYGSTELGATAAGNPMDPAALRRDVIGPLMPGVTILHTPGGPSTPPDPALADVLCFQHDCGFECYVGVDGNAISEPDGSLPSGHRFRSNDVGRLIDGYLSVHGRSDDLVNRDGLLVACGEVAAAVRTIRGIADAAILSGPMSRRGRALVAFCVLETNSPWEFGSLRKACLDVLPPRAVPDQFVFLPNLPRLPSGKVDRMALHHHIQPEIHTDADIP